MRYEVNCASGKMSRYENLFPFEMVEEYGVKEYYIEISSLEDLNKFIKEVGQVVMSNNEIVIYDDYME